MIYQKDRDAAESNMSLYDLHRDVLGRESESADEEGESYALLALAATNAFIIWKSWSFIWAMITDGAYTPAAVTAAPKMAPEATDFRVVMDILGRWAGESGDAWEMEEHFKLAKQLPFI